MNGTTKAYDLVNGEYVEKTFGSVPGIIWTDDNGNDMRTLATNLPFSTNNETYQIYITKQIKPKGLSVWLNLDTYTITAGNDRYRYLNTGQLIRFPDGSLCNDPSLMNPPVPFALDPVSGNIVVPTGAVTNGKFFTIMIGFNPFSITQSVFSWIYMDMANKEGIDI